MSTFEVLRLLTIRHGLEVEMNGGRLTRKTPSCFAIIKREFGIKVARGPDGKGKAYVAFCEQVLNPKLKSSNEGAVES